MEMKQYEELKHKLCKELEEISKKKDFNMGDIESIEKLTASIKNVEKIMMEDGYSQRMYSRDGNWNANGSYGRYNSYDDYSREYNDGNSYARRGMHYVRGHYSRAEGMDDVASKIEEMMHDGSLTSEDKSTLRRALDIARR